MEALLQRQPSVKYDGGISKEMQTKQQQQRNTRKSALKDAVKAPPPIVKFTQTDPDRIYCLKTLSKVTLFQ